MSHFALSAAFGIALIITSADAAFAEELTPSRNWSACYLGANAGYGRARNEATDSPFTQGPFATDGTSWNSIGPPYEVIKSDDHGVIAGIEAGCDRQVDLDGLTLVFGGAVDFSVINLGSSGTSAIATDTHASFDTDWAGTARLRAGLAADDLLFYVTGGLAVANIGVRAYDSSDWPTIGQMSVSGEETKSGWVAGAGAEWRFAENWSATLEYLHYDFGKVTATGAAIEPVGAYPRYENDLDFDVVRVGIRWRM